MILVRGTLLVSWSWTQVRICGEEETNEHDGVDQVTLQESRTRCVSGRASWSCRTPALRESILLLVLAGGVLFASVSATAWCVTSHVRRVPSTRLRRQRHAKRASDRLAMRWLYWRLILV